MGLKKTILCMVIVLLLSGMAVVLSAQNTLSYRWQYYYYRIESDMYEKAVKCFRGDNAAEAANIFEQLIERKPYDFHFRFLLATAYHKMGQLQEAAAVCEDMQIRFPYDIRQLSRSFYKNMTYSQLFYILGTAYFNDHRYQEAVDAFQRILKSHNYVVPNSSRAEIYCLLPLNRKSFYALVHYQLGTTYISMGDKEAALEQYNKLKKLDQEKSENLYNLINRKESAV
jgi:tetratricopeptide (TPR) repeat protein